MSNQKAYAYFFSLCKNFQDYFNMNAFFQANTLSQIIGAFNDFSPRLYFYILLSSLGISA